MKNEQKKKPYTAPTIEVIEVQRQGNLLEGSPKLGEMSSRTIKKQTPGNEVLLSLYIKLF